MTAMASTRQTLSLLCHNSLRESGSNCRPMSTAYRDSSSSYLTRPPASSRSSAENGTRQAQRESIPVGVYTGIVHPTLPHAPSSHGPTQAQCAGTSPQGAHRTWQLQAPPTSIKCPVQVYLTQRIIQLKRRRSNNTTIPKWLLRNAHTQPSKITSIFLHVHTTPHRRQFLRLAQRRAARQAKT
jgi:hypothetical protein